MDCKVWSHDLGNLPRSYYYVKKALQVVRSVINIRVKERVYSIFKNKVHIIHMQWDAWYKTWYMRGVLYAILTLRNRYSVGYLLPSLETFHSTTTEKKQSPIHRCCHTWGLVLCDKTKTMTQQNSCTTQPKQIFTVCNNKNHLPYSWNFVQDYKTTPHFLYYESGKNFRLIFE
jgi:hypothetical protein